MHLADFVGWAATSVFVTSYTFKDAGMLRRVQMLGAAIWIGYGVLMQAPPVIVANILVLGAATWAARRQNSQRPAGQRAESAFGLRALPPVVD